MNAFNRMFVCLLASAWLAALAGVLFLIWDERTINIDSENLLLNFDLITSSRAEQILATLIVAALALPGIGLLLAEFMPHRQRVRETHDLREYDRLQERVDNLQRQLDQRQPERVEYKEKTEVTRPERHDVVEPRRRRWGFLERTHR